MTARNITDALPNGAPLHEVWSPTDFMLTLAEALQYPTDHIEEQR
jgi:hypothetical protein